MTISRIVLRAFTLLDVKIKQRQKVSSVAFDYIQYAKIALLTL